MTRDVPIKNIGNIPLDIQLDVSAASRDPTYFSVVPAALRVAPSEVSDGSARLEEGRGKGDRGDGREGEWGENGLIGQEGQ